MAFSVQLALTRLFLFKCGCQVQPSDAGITFRLARDKAEKWIAAIDGYLLTGRLMQPGTCHSADAGLL